MLEKNGFFEREISNKIETFGTSRTRSARTNRVARRRMQNHSRGASTASSSFNDGTRWWVVTVFWDSERPNNPIPAKYLPK